MKDREMIEFVRGYIDATDSEDIYQHVGISTKYPYKIVYEEELRYRYDVPDLSECESEEELISRMESHGWEYEPFNN